MFRFLYIFVMTDKFGEVVYLLQSCGRYFLPVTSIYGFVPPWGALMCPRLRRSVSQRERRNRFFFCPKAEKYYVTLKLFFIV